MNTKTTLQERLKQARKAAGYTQKDVAEAGIMAQSSYSELERGESDSTSMIVELAALFNVDPLALKTGKGWGVERESYEARRDKIFRELESFSPAEQEKIISDIVTKAIRNK